MHVSLEPVQMVNSINKQLPTGFLLSKSINKLFALEERGWTLGSRYLGLNPIYLYENSLTSLSLPSFLSCFSPPPLSVIFKIVILTSS